MHNKGINAEKEGINMDENFITLRNETFYALSERARREGTTPSALADRLLNATLVSPHKMNEKEQERAFDELRELELSVERGEGE